MTSAPFSRAIGSNVRPLDLPKFQPLPLQAWQGLLCEQEAGPASWRVRLISTLSHSCPPPTPGIVVRPRPGPLERLYVRDVTGERPRVGQRREESVFFAPFPMEPPPPPSLSCHILLVIITAWPRPCGMRLFRRSNSSWPRNRSGRVQVASRLRALVDCIKYSFRIL